MSDRFIRRPFAVAAAAVALLAAACSATTAQPGQVEGGPSVSPAPSAVASSTASVPSPSTTVAKPSAAARKCLGAVEFVVDAAGKGPSSVCIAIGGIVRVEHLGPGLLSVDPREKVSCFYAGGVHVCRLIYTGTVKFRIHLPGAARTVTVTSAEASSPPKPSPACMDAGPFTVSALEAMPFSAHCVRVGSLMHVENVGPYGFTVSPAGAVTCVREPAVSHCRFVKVATVGFTFTARPADDILYVVSIG